MKLAQSDACFGYCEFKEKVKQQQITLEFLNDFLEWLFETELDYTTQDEMLAKFNEHENKGGNP